MNIPELESTDVLKLSSITGQHINTIQAGKEAITLNMNELANGIYFISVSKADGTVESFQFVKENE